MKKTSLIFLVISLISLNCAGQKRRISAQQTELDNLKREIVFLKEQNSQFKREQDNLTKQLEELALTDRQNKADFATKIDELLQQVEAVQNQLQETNYRITELKRNPGILESVPAGQPDAPNDSTSGNALQRGSNDAREIYNTAYRDLIRGNFQLALHGFQQFLDRHPDTELSDNAQYWIGEVYYAQGRFPKAIEEFEKVIKFYRNGDKKASALLKIAFAYISIDETEQGKVYLEEVIQQHPESREAELAKGRLATIN